MTLIAKPGISPGFVIYGKIIILSEAKDDKDTR